MNYLKLLLILCIAAFALAPGSKTEESLPQTKLKVPLYSQIVSLALILAKEENWSRCVGKIMCPSNFNAGGEYGWARSSSANKQTQTYVCNINADSLFYFITGKSANFHSQSNGINKVSIDSKRDSQNVIAEKIKQTFLEKEKPWIHHMIILVDGTLGHFITLLQERDKISLFQSFSYQTPLDKTKYCSYSLKDYLTKNSEGLFSKIYLDKNTQKRSSLISDLEAKGFNPRANPYINQKTVDLSLFVKDLIGFFSSFESLTSNYQKMFACPLPPFFKEDYFSRKGIDMPNVWIGIQSTQIMDLDLNFFKKSLQKDSCQATK